MTSTTALRPATATVTATGTSTARGGTAPRQTGADLAVRTSPLPADVLLGLARKGVLEALAATHPVDRYAAAHLAALRAAAAVLACRARPATGPGRRSRPTSAWVLLAAVAPELGEWAAFFAAGAGKRAAAEAGAVNAVTPREADDLVRDTQNFLAVVETTLGLAHQPLLIT